MIVYVDTSEIRQGKLDEAKVAMTDLAQFVEENEPQLVSYEFYLDEGENSMTVVAVHPDSASMEFHMEVAGERFKPFADLITLRSIDVFGEPSSRVVELLEEKARMLGAGTVRVHHRHAGFDTTGKTAATR